jgi:F-type H+-transporting ATPase subunit delta
MKSSRKTRRAARRLFRMCVVDGRFDEARARTIAHRIATSGRGRSFPILWDFLRLVRIDLSRRTALVESAVELPDDIRNDVSARLTRTYGAGLTTTFAVNPALVGGISIKVGSDVYDGSVRAKLAALEARL